VSQSGEERRQLLGLINRDAPGMLPKEAFDVSR
jgi:hypothetical protein